MLKFRILCGGKGGHLIMSCRGKKPGRHFNYILSNDCKYVKSLITLLISIEL